MAKKTGKPTPATIHASLPPSMRAWVKDRVQRGGFGNVSEYIRLLIRRDQQDPAATDSPMRDRVAMPARYPDSVRETAIAEPGSFGAPATSASLTEVDFDSATWRELRAAILHGDRQLMSQRMAEATGLLRGALETRRAMLRMEHPAAARSEIESRLASWLFEQGTAAPGDSADPTWRRSSAERVQRLTKKTAPTRPDDAS